MDKVNKTEKKNRRVFFRIYDEVNLFYQKIDEKQLAGLRPHPVGGFSADSGRASVLPALERKRPDDLFKENETCNINISASGMAFSSDHMLQEGDILLIMTQLASSLAVIQTYANVVYCKNNQPYDAEYPYFVGAHFIDMEDEYQTLLGEYIEKKRQQQIRVRAALITALIIVLAVPGLVFSLLFELLHFILEIFLHISHLIFEFVELNLDHVIEHFFETDLHQTQVIVFYIIASFITYGLYRLVRTLPFLWRRCKKNQLAFWTRKKSNLEFFWRELTLFDKIKLTGAVVFVIGFYVFFGM